MRKKFFKEGKKYTFSDYFEMSHPIEEILSELGYSYSTEMINLPRNANFNPEVVNNLRSFYYSLVPKVSVNSEIAKRELMIAPLLHTVTRLVSDARLNIEYPIDLNDRLGGTIDYLFRSSQELIVIEAKKGDLEKGFNQLAVEMIAVDQYEENGSPLVLYGAITIGEVWRFAILGRKQKHLVKDIHTFRFPEDLEDLVAILKGILDPLDTLLLT